MKACRALWSYRGLLVRLVSRALAQRYKGSVLGFAWALLQPLLVLLAYWFLFGLVLKGRWPTDQAVPLHIVIFSGLIVAGFFTECLNTGVGTIIANANYVKKVVFPLEIQAIVTCLAAYFHLLINIGILMMFMVAGGTFHWQVLYAPLLLLPLLMVAVGAVWILSALAVYLRDLLHVVPLATSLLLFFAPVFYPMILVPATYRGMLWLNPLTAPVEVVHVAVGLSASASFEIVVLGYAFFGVLVLMMGHWIFQKLRRGFADVL